jgi:hypothetical protein
VLQYVGEYDGRKRSSFERQRVISIGDHVSRGSKVHADIVCATWKRVAQPPITATDVEHGHGVATQEFPKDAPA